MSSYRVPPLGTYHMRGWLSAIPASYLPQIPSMHFCNLSTYPWSSFWKLPSRPCRWDLQGIKRYVARCVGRIGAQHRYKHYLVVWCKQKSTYPKISASRGESAWGKHKPSNVSRFAFSLNYAFANKYSIYNICVFAKKDNPLWRKIFQKEKNDEDL